MSRSFLLLLFVVHVKSEPKTFQHEYYVSRQSRDNAVPTQTGYVFSRMDDKPATFQSLANHPSAPSALGDAAVKAHSDTGYVFSRMDDKPTTFQSLANYPSVSSALSDAAVKAHSDIGSTQPTQSMSEQYGKSLLDKFSDMPPMQRSAPFKMLSTVGNFVFTGVTESMPYVTKSWGKHSIDYEIAKAKSKYGMEPSMSIKADKDYMKDNLSKIEHKYSPPASTSTDIKPVYDFDREFHIDDDDVKTLSGTTLEWWPYFLHSPYEYESIKMDSNIQKAKEKRYAMESEERIIPVHERQEDYSHVYGPRHIEPQYDRSEDLTGRGGGSVGGSDGFVSFVLKDFGNNYDNDPLELKWGSAFDANDNTRQNTGKRNRRLDNLGHLNDQGNTDTKIDVSRTALGDKSHEHGYEKKHEFNNHESGDSKNHNHNSERAQSENNASAFKDVVDQFANRYGGEDHKRHSAFAFKRNSDNGEKKKGFRRVYHKDEYQEDNEYYDNTNNSAKAEDSGSSIAHLGGSTAAIQSHAAAAAGNKANSFNEVENKKKNEFEKNHRGHDAKKGLDRDFSRHRDDAHSTANRDYVYLYP